jgi:hypothetical protein
MGALRAGREARRDVGAMIDEAGSEIQFADADVLAVNEFHEMSADEVLHFRVGHAGFGVFLFREFQRCVQPGSPSYRPVRQSHEQILRDAGLKTRQYKMSTEDAIQAEAA